MYINIIKNCNTCICIPNMSFFIQLIEKKLNIEL